ncbi:uncharacterized protein LOC122818934 [Drosophila biarmipes]|uniref:uncharacterized protein LOC122818934 n=1 Tax=Drosophila biarmipes TaxID=125945 RepID=UPI0021CC867E|nr:uncharacterized protein LOC122818934 [Drosophila biarmipes]
MMPTKHSPRRSPRLEASGVPATATTTATATGTATSSASVAGDRQRPQTPKESGTAARKAASNLQPEATGQTTDSTTVVAALMERIARLESELAKARASGGQAGAARDPVGTGARGVGVSGAANTPSCSSGTLPHHGAAPRQSENLPRQMRDNLQTDLGVTPSLQLPAQVSANLPPQWSANLATTLGGHWANGQPVSTTTILRTTCVNNNNTALFSAILCDRRSTAGAMLCSPRGTCAIAHIIWNADDKHTRMDATQTT